ncbi:counting factor associated protein D-like isoform X2 [Cydia pomonella]|uniref:counting factor associated protein D-like isoform X2 n=1 Tax=Cydia pomonella TaxID=82600 RepID=UPI002ADE1ABF|nr:counting factor associated protein D-like isoform X2 [Cydia pomonella]
MKIVLCVALCAVAVSGSPGLFGGFGDSVSSTLTKLPQSVNQRVNTVQETIPFSDGRFDKVFGSSDEMVKSFRKQQTKSFASLSDILPAGLKLPDLKLPTSLPIPGIPGLGLPSGSPGSSGGSGPAPPRPKFERSLHLHEDLIVPLSGFTQSFEIEWHAESDTMRKVLEGGNTVYRSPKPDGKVEFLEIREDQEGKSKAHRCTRTVVSLAAPAHKSFPGLPDLSDYDFVGTATSELWRKVIKGKPGENGAVKGETLTVTHEMLVAREKEGPVPVRYSVTTDSSILGPASDVYIHTYKILPPPTAAIKPDTTKCKTIEDATPRQKRADFFSKITDTVSKFNPVQDLSLPFGGDIGPKFDSFKDQFKRNYLDPAEEAVRKNLLTQSTRFIEAGNRATSSFKMGVNFLADRLEEEISQLFGVREPEGLVEVGMVPFPYSETEVKTASDKLPEEFDWRKYGAVSPVRYQGTTCASCWAFAVAASTEGALFKKTNKLVPLSPQCLVDCGKAFGAQGCGPTWPSFAYDYIKSRGLAAWDEYDYEAKVLECKDTKVSPVTHISGHVNVTAKNEDALKLAIKNHAPTVVLVDAMAKSFIYYESGVLNDKKCGQSKPRLNHAVLAVGWGSKDDSKDAPHFILKNSWSDKWGDEGYIKIAPESCAVLERPTYSLVQQPNVDREALRSSYKED